MDEVEIQTLHDPCDFDCDSDVEYDSENSENDSIPSSCEVVKEEMEYDHLNLNQEANFVPVDSETGQFSGNEIGTKSGKSFHWTKETTLLLLREYQLRLDKFKNPKYRKSDLWNEISLVFRSYEFEIHRSLLDKKFRNLKNTFVNIFFNSVSKNSKKPVKWEYYYIFLELFKDDETFKLPASYEVVKANEVNLELLSDKDLNLPAVKPISETNVEEKPIAFSWNQEKCFLLLQEYKARLPYFRDPKLLKKPLWTEIRNVFKTLGFETTEDILYKKFRNMKQTFKSNTKSEKKSKWIYHNIFVELFNDQLDEVDLSAIDAYEDNVYLDSETHETDEFDLNDPIEFPETDKQRTNPDSEENAYSILEIQRKRLKLDIERTSEMKKMRIALETSNQLQKYRNDLLEKLINIVKTQ